MAEDEYLEKDYPWLDENENVSKAFSIFNDHDIIFLNREGSFSGAVTKKHMLRTKISHQTKLKTLKDHPPVLDMKWKIGEAARLMVENDVFIIPVVVNDKIHGVVNGDRILARASEGTFGEESVREYMSSPVETVTPDDTVARAEALMKEKGISRLLVEEEGRIVGIITMDDLIETIYHPENRPRGTDPSGDGSKYGDKIAEKRDYLKMPVRGIMSEALTLMSPDSRVRDVVKKMDEMGYRGMILEGSGGERGIVTKKDLIRPVAEYFRPGNFMIQFSGELDHITDFNREQAREVLLDHLGMHEQYLGPNELVVMLKNHKETRKGLNNTFCELRLTSPGHRYVATDEGWGYLQALRNTSQALEKQIRRGKRA